MSDLIYIAMHDNGEAATGKSLKEAYETLEGQVDCSVEDVYFYEAVPIEVEIKFVKKETVKSIKAK